MPSSPVSPSQRPRPAVKTPRFAYTPPARPVPPLVRRVSDAQGRQWTARPLASRTGPTVFFRCDALGVRPEVRRADDEFDRLTDEVLAELLERGDE